MGTDDSGSFWRDPNRSLLGLCYMGGSAAAFAAGVTTGTQELFAIGLWVVVTVAFYWVVHGVLRGQFGVA